MTVRRSPLQPWSAKRRHRPPHAYDAGRALFITAATFERAPHLRSAERKDGFVAQLQESTAEAAIELLAWVVLNDHYHVVIFPDDPASVPGWLKALHGSSSTAWNKEEDRRGRTCWYRSWDVTLWTEGDLWSRINYIHNNPVRHGYVADVRDWRWSSLADFDAVWEEETARANRDRFPAPRRLPHDEF